MRKPCASEPPELMGARVLVVEDSWEVSTGLKALLESCGAEVVGPVATASDAKHLVSESVPDVALVDINLRAGERSYGLIEEMHALCIPVVVITGYANTAPATDKALAVLRKPFSEGELLATLHSVKMNSIERDDACRKGGDSAEANGG
jgi:DNA-binding LytR/AlgR family response regulator